MHAYDRQLPPLRCAHAHTETESAANALTYGLFLRGRWRGAAILLCIREYVHVHAPLCRAQSHASSRYLGQAFSRFALYPDTLGICFIKRGAVAKKEGDR